MGAGELLGQGRGFSKALAIVTRSDHTGPRLAGSVLSAGEPAALGGE